MTGQTTRLPRRSRLAVGLGRRAASLSRGLGLGSGSVIGGRLATALDPGLLSHLAAGRDVVLVSGTNGTTARMLVGALATRGPVATNRTGSNLPAGLATALGGSPRDAPAVLEVDEQWLPSVIADVAPALTLLLNLSRDQLDRAGEVRAAAQAWRAVLEAHPDTPVIANADDPLVAWAASASGDVTWVGVGHHWTEDAGSCPACGHLIRFTPGRWTCTSCRLRRPVADVALAASVVCSPAFGSLPLELSVPGRCNLANATMAIAAAIHLGVEPTTALEATTRIESVDGRYSRVRVMGGSARLLLAKNPVGWMETLDIIGREPNPVVVLVNDRIADGRDVSWLWDVPFEQLRGRPVVAAGTRALDLSLRLRYAGVPHTVERDLLSSFRSWPHDGEVDIVANYTAFQWLRRVLRVA